MSIATTRMTYDELLQMPDDGKRYEIIAGELYVSPSPGWHHQRVLNRILFAIGRYLEDRGLPDTVFPAPLDVNLSDYDVVQPDIVYIRPERVPAVRGVRAPVEGAPDLAIEVLSKSTRAHDERRKLALYAAFGVPEYWIVDIDARLIRVLLLHGDAYREQRHPDQAPQSVVLPGLLLEPGYVFDGLD